ncbi:MAG: hypothetical protein WAU68_07135 [Vitreimonas sp.]
MRFVAEPISDLRLTRFHRWAMLWLKWFAGFLDAAGALAPISAHAERIGHAWLDRIERVIVAIVMLRAARRVRCIWSHRPFAVHRLKHTALKRAVIGAKLRRALRPKDLRDRIEALTHSIECMVVRVLKRLPRGLTRRRPIRTAPQAQAAEAPRAEHTLTLALNSS